MDDRARSMRIKRTNKENEVGAREYEMLVKDVPI